MDSILAALLSWQFLFFCLAIGAVVFVIRIIVEYAMENWWPLKQWRSANKDSKIWRSLILPILPVGLGLAAGVIAKAYPYPDGIISTSGRMAFGLVGGFTSSLVVRLYTAFLSSKVGEYRDKVNTMLNQRGPRDEVADQANIAAKDQVADEKDTADDLLDHAKEVADNKVARAKVVADDKLADAQAVAADKLASVHPDIPDNLTVGRNLRE